MKQGFPAVLAYRDQNECFILSFAAKISAACESWKHYRDYLPNCRMLFSLPEQLIEGISSVFLYGNGGFYLPDWCGGRNARDTASRRLWHLFYRENNCTYVILCDGMGSGKLPGRIKKAVRLLESFIKAGISPEQAAEIITRRCCLTVKASGLLRWIAEIMCARARSNAARRRLFCDVPSEKADTVTELWPGGPDVVDKGGENGVYTLLRPRVIKQL